MRGKSLTSPVVRVNLVRLAPLPRPMRVTSNKSILWTKIMFQGVFKSRTRLDLKEALKTPILILWTFRPSSSSRSWWFLIQRRPMPHQSKLRAERAHEFFRTNSKCRARWASAKIITSILRSKERELMSTAWLIRRNWSSQNYSRGRRQDHPALRPANKCLLPPVLMSN